MDLIQFIALNLLIAFIGFAIGRLTDKWGDHYPTPHHWIYGFITMVIGLLYIPQNWAFLLFSFGIAHFISDLEDFLHLKIIGRDPKIKNWKFWSIK